MKIVHSKSFALTTFGTLTEKVSAVLGLKRFGFERGDVIRLRRRVSS